jgi:hypothetical protein
MAKGWNVQPKPEQERALDCEGPAAGCSDCCSPAEKVSDCRSPENGEKRRKRDKNGENRYKLKITDFLCSRGKWRKTEKNGEKGIKTEKKGEKRRKREKNGEKGRKTEKTVQFASHRPATSRAAMCQLAGHLPACDSASQPICCQPQAPQLTLRLPL